jgi:hypothetical protein
MSTTPLAAAPERAGKIAPGEIAIGVVIGRLSEMFDFFVFGIASVLVFPKVFFPFVDEKTGTFYSFFIFSLASRSIRSSFFPWRLLRVRSDRCCSASCINATGVARS